MVGNSEFFDVEITINESLLIFHEAWRYLYRRTQNSDKGYQANRDLFVLNSLYVNDELIVDALKFEGSDQLRESASNIIDSIPRLIDLGQRHKPIEKLLRGYCSRLEKFAESDIKLREASKLYKKAFFSHDSEDYVEDRK